jgi:hypothetical protein
MQNRKIIVAVALLAVAACARAYPPPGGERDITPPRLVGTTPEPLAVVPGFRDAVVFSFDERLSERSFSEALVLVSPQDGALRVERAGREIRVRIDGGWQPDRVYRVVLLPGVRDLFGNIRAEQTEVIFSTGPAITPTAIAGIVLDRITGRPPQQGVVQAVRAGDSTAYQAVTDSAGFFSLRHLPLGEYVLQAYADMNRNRRRDPAEPVDSGRIAALQSDADTVAVVFHVLPPDTTPPRIVRAEAIDSLHVRVTFDDYFDPEQPLAGAAAEVHQLPDSTRVAGARRLLHGPLFDREHAAARAQRADTAAARPDTAARQLGVVPPARADTARPRPPAQAPAAPAADRPLLPAREIVVELDRPLVPGAAHFITVAGVVNISGLTGGGTARFEAAAAAPPPPPPPVQPPPDTIGRGPRRP